jgi:hypothetical protein
MMGLAIRCELLNVVAVQRPHDADPRQHRRAAFRRDQQKRLRRLPFWRLWHAHEVYWLGSLTKSSSRLSNRFVSLAPIAIIGFSNFFQLKMEIATTAKSEL